MSKSDNSQTDSFEVHGDVTKGVSVTTHENVPKTRKPNGNIIVGQANVAEFHRKLDILHDRSCGNQNRLDRFRETQQEMHDENQHQFQTVADTLATPRPEILLLTSEIESKMRWALLRDCIIIALLLYLCLMASINTSVIQGWVGQY